MNDKTCLFCKIILGEIPSTKIYENEIVYAFLDIKPINPGHTLVIPKEHFKNLYDLPDKTAAEIFIVVRDIGKAVKKAFSADGINLEMNNEEDAGQIIHHAHIHIIPRYKGDGLRHWPGRDLEKTEAETIAQKIRNFL